MNLILISLVFSIAALIIFIVLNKVEEKWGVPCATLGETLIMCVVCLVPIVNIGIVLIGFGFLLYHTYDALNNYEA